MTGRAVVFVAGGLVALVALVASSSSSSTHKPKAPPHDAPLPSSVPRGFRRMRDREVTAELRALAVQILHSDLHVGSVAPLDETHAALIELHRNGTEHRGVSLLVRDT